MAASKPVIATDTGGIAEVIIEGKTGFLVQKGNVEQLANQVTILLDNQKLRKQLGYNAAGFLGSDFTVEGMINSTSVLYEGFQ